MKERWREIESNERGRMEFGRGVEVEKDITEVGRVCVYIHCICVCVCEWERQCFKLSVSQLLFYHTVHLKRENLAKK